MNILPPILFEDESLIAFDKPSGLLVAPDRWDKTLINLMKLVHQKISSEIFNVHRLDKETSGILLCAKTKQALDFLSQQFESQKVNKHYMAITLGSPPEKEMTIKRSIGEDFHHPGKMRLSHQYGKEAETLIKIITQWRGYSLVEAFPKTGRTHQIRIHLASIGSPIVADPLYGDGKPLLLSEIKSSYKQKKDEPERPLLGRLALHAASLTVIHPVERKSLTIESPLPKEFEVTIKYLKRFVGL